MITHDPSEYIRQLQQILISDKKRIAFLFGAGTSLFKKNKESLIPAIKEMTEDVQTTLSKEDKYENSIKEIKEELGEKYNIETFLSNLEQKINVIGVGSLNGLTKRNFQKLAKKTKGEIKKKVSAHKDVKVRDLIHTDFAEWIGRANRKYPIEIFTTNYDYLFEIGLEEKNIPFYDGFTGSYVPFFNAESIEDMSFIPNQTKLWKMHGSLGWHYDKKDKKVCRKNLIEDKDILIYPSILKYNDSKKLPYVALIDRLINFLKQPDAVLITCGYSFGDDHINERILAALNRDYSGHVFALFYDKDDNKNTYLLTENCSVSELAKRNRKLSFYGCRNAVIGGKFGEWELKREPDKEDTINVNLYFDEDAPNNSNDEKNKARKGDEIWTGRGELIIPDFSKFVAFLQSMILKDESLRDDRNE